ncbi:hypothetical protein CONPUDRAFT_58530 [Coniophora puteana RWD-64-598 SS2]|uniref:Uncharacterized protein n=1 Tax=Coniophora puteana (strain RWD-64-598) TaxID=741705 RepID=A0A5M3MLE1_CONPW|nr:uncharacterized protein CONPUDRAFT_58530 [Coniophora puteana RWD-64-598 SS2]EIW79978.1 hypothetical protein CONPUDRAFT_58530 [Coniophora puteana RWD-64-598 SS2]
MPGPDTTVPLVSVNLATVCIESFLYGIFFVLTVSSVYLLIWRSRMSNGGHSRSAVFTSPMFVAAIMLFVLITGHWICTVLRLFQAFVMQDPSQALPFYADLSQNSEVIKTAFLMSSLVVGDVMMIYRLWTIWNRNYKIIIFPCLTLVGLTVCGAGIVYQFTVFTPGESVFLSAAGRWITSDCVFTLVSKSVSGVHLMPVLATFVESAAMYTSWTIFFFGSYQSGSNMQFLAVDGWAAMAGISYMLINVRVGLGWASNGVVSQGRALSTTSQTFDHQRGTQLAVRVTTVVRDDGAYELGHKRNDAGLDSQEF